MSDAVQVLNEARQQAAAGKASAALRVLQEGVKQHPGDPALLVALADIYVETGQPGPALRVIDLARHGGVSDVRLKLRQGDALRQQGKLQPAANLFQEVIQADEGNADAWVGLGRCLLQAGDMERATSCMVGAVNAAPDNPGALLALSNLYRHQRQLAKAEALVNKVLEREPDHLGARLELAEILLAGGQRHEADRVMRPFRDHPEKSAEVLAVLIEVELWRGAAQEAIDYGEKLLELRPGESRAHAWLGWAHHLKGDRATADELLTAVCRETPQMLAAWPMLVSVRKDGLSDAELSLLRKQTEKPLPPLGQSKLRFVLAEHYQKMGDWDAEFREIAAGNRARAAISRHDDREAWESARRMRETFTAAHIDALAQSGDRSMQPVFLLCLPRSGSSLLESMLGNHSALTALGEDTALDVLIKEERERLGIKERDTVPFLPAESVRRISDRLSAHFRGLAGEGTRVVEKGVINYLDAGFLKCLFPDARFIELRRNVLDVTVGSFRQNFNNQDFSLTLKGCANAYARFEAQMAHWHEVMPDAIHRVDYEELVENPEPVLAGVLEFLGLPWEDACLDHQSRDRVVVTASLDQVREKLFTQGVGRWRRYARHLDPLLAELDRLGISYDKEAVREAAQAPVASS